MISLFQSEYAYKFYVQIRKVIVDTKQHLIFKRLSSEN